jgi:nucleotide-binding universal stress UspA family protein
MQLIPGAHPKKSLANYSFSLFPQAEKVHADLVVVGATGKSALER